VPLKFELANQDSAGVGQLFSPETALNTKEKGFIIPQINHIRLCRRRKNQDFSLLTKGAHTSSQERFKIMSVQVR